jgi:hypothetical protein
MNATAAIVVAITTVVVLCEDMRFIFFIHEPVALLKYSL